METEWPEGVESLESHETDGEFGFGEGVSVAQMDKTVDVGVRECDHEFLLALFWVGLMEFVFSPDLDGLIFELDESVSSFEGLNFCFFVHD